MIAPHLVWSSPMNMYGIAFVPHGDPLLARMDHEALLTLLNEIKQLTLYPSKPSSRAPKVTSEVDSFADLDWSLMDYDAAVVRESWAELMNASMPPKIGLYTSYFDLSHLFPRPEDLGYIVAGEYAAPKMDLLLEALLDPSEVLSIALGYHLRQLNVDVELFLPDDVPVPIPLPERIGNEPRNRQPPFHPDAVLDRPLRIGIRGSSLAGMNWVQESAGHVLGAATGWCVTASVRMRSSGLHLGHVVVNQLLEAHRGYFDMGLAPRWIWTSPFDLHGLAFVLRRDPQDVRRAHEALYAVLNEIKVLSQYPNQLRTGPYTEYYPVHPNTAGVLKKHCDDGSIAERILMGREERVGPGLTFDMHSIADFDPYPTDLNPAVVRESWAGWYMITVAGPPGSRGTRKLHPDDFYGFPDFTTALGILNLTSSSPGIEYESALQSWLETYFDWGSIDWHGSTGEGEAHEGEIEGGRGDE
ncbi:hypothetical protein GGF32_010089 [Allomyces javanicus]|nr:hypothetical protein GGF32_010089 [Allomyces javanicus]